MKILLLNPPADGARAFIREGRCTQEQGVWATLWPPITLATAGAMLEQEGHAVDILDCAARRIARSDLLDKIKQKGYRLVAWSTSTPTIKSDLALAAEVKEIDGAVLTVVMGTHVTVLADACLREVKGLDVVIRNEPEETLTALAERVSTQSGIASIAGISFVDDRGKVRHNPSRPFIKNLDRLPYPAWHLLDLDGYKLPLVGEKFLMLSPVRGCPFPCTFCTARTYYGSLLRKRSAEKMADEIGYNMDRFGIRQFFIWADTFSIDRDYVMQFCRQIRDRGLDIGWACNSRVDTVDPELLMTMAGAGCWMISFGFESGDQSILNDSKKKITLSQSREAARMARAAGIKVTGHFILGLPGETEETLNKTLNFALTLDIDMVQFYCAVPFPGSTLYETALVKRWIDGGEFHEFRQDNAVMNLPGLPPWLVNEYRRKGFFRFYVRPRGFSQILKFTRAGGKIETVKAGFRFIRWMAS